MAVQKQVKLLMVSVQNVYPLVAMVNGSLSYNADNVKFENDRRNYQIAQTQTHNTFMGRQTVIQETLLCKY